MDAMNQSSLREVSLLLARTQREVVGLKADLMRRGATVLSAPTLQIQEVGGWADDVFSDHVPKWTIVTTKGAAERLTRAIRAGLGEHQQLGAIAAIGRTTAQYLEKYGLWPQLSCETHDVHELVAQLQGRGIEKQLLRVVGPEGQSDALVQELLDQGAQVESVAVYQSIVEHGDLSMFQQDDGALPKLIVFPSLQTVHSLAALLHEADAKSWWSLPVAAIGPTTAEAAKEYGFEVVAMPEPLHTMTGLADAIEAWVQQTQASGQ